MKSYEKEIEALREQINKLNVEIVQKLSERKDVAIRIGEVKKRHGLPIVDKSREKEIYHQIKELASEYKIRPDGAERVFREIIKLFTEAELEE